MNWVLSTAAPLRSGKARAITKWALLLVLLPLMASRFAAAAPLSADSPPIVAAGNDASSQSSTTGPSEGNATAKVAAPLASPSVVGPAASLTPSDSGPSSATGLRQEAPLDARTRRRRFLGLVISGGILMGLATPLTIVGVPQTFECIAGACPPTGSAALALNVAGHLMMATGITLFLVGTQRYAAPSTTSPTAPSAATDHAGGTRAHVEPALSPELAGLSAGGSF